MGARRVPVKARKEMDDALLSARQATVMVKKLTMTCLYARPGREEDDALLSARRAKVKEEEADDVLLNARRARGKVRN